MAKVRLRHLFLPVNTPQPYIKALINNDYEGRNLYYYS